MSPSKLHPHLELCQFSQALLKTKFARWRAHFLVRISKIPMCIIHRNRWCTTWGKQPERGVSYLESQSYNKSHPSPNAYGFSKIDDQKSFLVCFESLLDFPKYHLHIIHFQWSVLLGSRLPLIRIIVNPRVHSHNHSALLVLLYWLSLSSTFLSVIQFWAMSLWPHTWLCVPILINLSKGMLSLIAPMIVVA
jgi:hypothetical protein